MKKENAFLQKLDKIGNLTQVVCLSLFLTGVSVQDAFAEAGCTGGTRCCNKRILSQGRWWMRPVRPVIGASVVVEGTTNGTITDFDGKFTLQCSERKKNRQSRLWGMRRRLLLRTAGKRR